MENNKNNIENANIKVGIRTVVLVLTATISIIVTIMRVYFGISYQIQTLQNTRTTDYQYYELRLKDQDSKIQFNADEIKDIKINLKSKPW